MTSENLAQSLRAICGNALIAFSESSQKYDEEIYATIEGDIEVARVLLDALMELPLAKLSDAELRTISDVIEHLHVVVNEECPTSQANGVEFARRVKNAVSTLSKCAAPKIPYLSVAQVRDSVSDVGYQYDQKPGTRFTPEANAILDKLRNVEYAVLVGRNNCGKSFILKTLTQTWGPNASYLGPARYQNFNLLGYYTPNRNRKNEKWNQFTNHWASQTNVDNSPINLQQAIAELSDAQRDKLVEIVKLLLGVTLEIRHTVPNNTMSQKYISVGGHNISYTSSGLRLIATLVTSLLDEDYDTVLIDEPELGISPEAQGILADFLFDRQHRAKFFSHIKTLIFATHSTVFLDRVEIANNYRVEKQGDEISIKKVETQTEFNRIHFFLLGNRFETLYLPSAIVVVEGKTDHKFIERALSLKFPAYQISVVAAHSDSRVKEIINVAKGLLTDIQKSPYRDRILVVLDSTHQKGLPSELAAMGVPKDRILEWPKNGIEYFYPPSIMADIFGGPDADLVIDGDMVSRNGRDYRKDDLANMVVSRMALDTEMHIEFQLRLIKKIEEIVGPLRS